MINSIVQKLASKPRIIFLIDGCGAILSAFLLGVVLVEFEAFFGIPTLMLHSLALVPVLFAIYDFYAYRKGSPLLGSYLKGIAIMNLLYCGLSVGLSFYHKDAIRFWGWCYILSELTIIAILVYVELKVAKALH